MISEVDTLKYFRSIIEREEIFVRKELLALPKEQWTNVEVYKKYRFCNVHRCYDKTYKLLNDLEKKIWMCTQQHLHPGLRTMLRWTACNSLIEWIIDNYIFDTDLHSFRLDVQKANNGAPEPLIARILDAYHDRVIPLVTGSFIVKRYGNDYEEMLAYYRVGARFYALLVDGTIHTSKQAVQFFKDHAPWCADFGAYCIVSDWLYILPEKFDDRYEWTAYGPGAFNGINLIVPTTKRNYLAHLQELHSIWTSHGSEFLAIICRELDMTEEQIDELCLLKGYTPMSKLLTQPLMLDVEHWLCEYAKYSRGWAKKKYN